MEISEERLQSLMQETAEKAAQSAVEKILEAPTIKQIVRRGKLGRMMQIRRASLTLRIMHKLGVNLNSVNISDLMREMIEIGLKEVRSTPLSMIAKEDDRERFSFRVSNDLLEMVKGSEESFPDLLILGLLCKALEESEMTKQK